MYITIGMGFAAWLFDWPLVIQQSLFLPCLTAGRFICSIGGCIVVLATLPIAHCPLTIHHYPFTIHRRAAEDAEEGDSGSLYVLLFGEHFCQVERSLSIPFVS